MSQIAASARLNAPSENRGNRWHVWALAAVAFVSLVLTAWNVRMARTRVVALSQQQAAHRQVHDVAGRRLPATDVQTLDGQRVTLDSILGSGPALIWFISSQDCLSCLAEVEEWKRFAERHPEMNVVAVASGSSPDPIRAFRESENVGFRIFYDGSGRVLRELGASGATPARIFAKGQVALLFAQGDEVGLGMLDLVERLLSPM